MRAGQANPNQADDGLASTDVSVSYRVLDDWLLVNSVDA